MKECLLYQKLDKKLVQCRTCNHYCTLKPGKRGICGVRENVDGQLFLVNYGKIIATAIDPIEKKPLFHFLPGTPVFSIAQAGCNFKCANCQNADISQITKETKDIPGEEIAPEKIIKLAIQNNCPSIAYTYTEPTVFLEYTFDVMQLATKKNIKNVFVSNGYMSPETIELIYPYLDAINVDLKFFNDKTYQKICGAKLEPILNTLKLLKKRSVWTEVTTLIIPGLSDADRELKGLADFISHKLDSHVPWHISRFHPAYKLPTTPVTPLKSLLRAQKIGKDAGLKYVYIGNLPGANGENTHCPHCDQLVIERFGYQVMRHDHNGQCPGCHNKVDLILK